MHKAPAERRKRFLSRHPRWQSRTLSQFLTESAESYPQRPLIITSGETYTYAQVNEWSQRLARGLVALGVEPGEHVAMVIPNYPEFVALKFAISRIGAVAVPLTFLFRKEELRYVIRQSDCSVLVTMERFRDLDYLQMLDEMAPDWEDKGGTTVFPKLRNVIIFNPDNTTRAAATNLADLEAAGEHIADSTVAAREATAQPDAVADIVYTSGTTGFPKGAMLTHDNVLISAYSSALVRGVDDGQKILFALPLYHVFSYVEGLLAAMWMGGAIIPQLIFDPVDTFEAIERHGADEALMVPTMTIALAEHPERSNYDLQTLRTIMSAAAPAPTRVWELVRQELGVTEIVTGYGQTETSASTTYTMPDDPLKLVSSTVGKPKPGGPAGDPGLGEDPHLGPLVAAYKTVDPITGEDLPSGQEGELAVRGPEVMRRYYNRPEETSAVFHGTGWMRSGDLGWVRSDGYIELTGRSKELYKCGGELVAPKEIEELLSARDDIAQAYVVGLQDDQMGEVGCAFVIPRSDAKLNTDDIISYCRENLARFKVPVRAILISSEDLPQTSTGKVQKFRLAERAQRLLNAK